ncbi:hypothetical protein MF271_10530 [Deinococcus sp. KNUC1210]|uniref:hypothetical protein n=1 Tax=Deinococcus sp. KNUC1210 TaxID=2917691 RepID=UPI001EF0F64C|nr:hypothetical protein [Deinococcus sp. KNUC1210]ULH14469.1 hypothetical protein MF271_10530 [Deinococcus sp. KNUC1210]
MTDYLLFGLNNVEEDSKAMLVDQFTLAQMEGKSAKAASRNYAGHTFLESYRRDVASFAVQEYRFTAGRARIMQPDWEPEVVSALKAELYAPPTMRKARGVLLETGRAPSRQHLARRTSAVRKARIEALVTQVPADHPARDLLLFLNAQPTAALRRMVHRNLDAAHSLAATLPDRSWQTRLYNLKLLHSIEQDEVPLYQPSREGRTARIFGIGPTYLMLSRPVRQQLLTGCTEFDLRAAQLALVAHQWNAVLLQEKLVRGGIDIWYVLAAAAGINPEVHRDLLKRAVYSLIYGKNEQALKQDLSAGIGLHAGIKRHQAQALMKSPLIRELVQCRAVRLRAINTAGHLTTIFGKTVRLSPQRMAPSLLAEELQALELAVLLPAFSYIQAQQQRRGELHVAAWQHDGFTLHCTDRTKLETHTRQLQRLVRRQLKHLGLPRLTMLVSKTLE